MIDRTYKRAIGRIRLLDADEEQTLAAQIAHGDQAARDTMIRANLRLVFKVALRYRGRGLDDADLVSEGTLGLIHAVEKHRPGTGRFAVLATYWVKHSVWRAIDNSSRTIRLPVELIKLCRKWRVEAEAMAERLGYQPTNAEVGRALRLSTNQVEIVVKALARERRQRVG
jgi:RNA polymerase primary sigma factor